MSYIERMISELEAADAKLQHQVDRSARGFRTDPKVLKEALANVRDTLRQLRDIAGAPETCANPQCQAQLETASAATARIVIPCRLIYCSKTCLDKHRTELYFAQHEAVGATIIDTSRAPICPRCGDRYLLERRKEPFCGCCFSDCN